LILAKELGMAPLQARCHLGRGGVYERMGQDVEARVELTYAVAMLQAMQMRYWLER
jgi:Flp pilus assembly protein TadD